MKKYSYEYVDILYFGISRQVTRVDDIFRTTAYNEPRDYPTRLSQTGSNGI